MPNPAQILLEETDPLRRLDAHLALGQRALARNDRFSARAHYTEAHELDPTDGRVLAGLNAFTPAPAPRRSLIGRWFNTSR